MGKAEELAQATGFDVTSIRRMLRVDRFNTIASRAESAAMGIGAGLVVNGSGIDLPTTLGVSVAVGIGSEVGRRWIEPAVTNAMVGKDTTRIGRVIARVSVGGLSMIPRAGLAGVTTHALTGGHLGTSGSFLTAAAIVGASRVIDKVVHDKIVPAIESLE